MAIVAATDGSPTKTGWKRRSSAASFSMCLRYSSSVVAPTQRSSPPAGIGLGVFAAAGAAREHRLEHVRGVDGALGRPRADDRVQLVDEDDDLAGRIGDLLEHGLEPPPELPAVLRAPEQTSDVERPDGLALERFRDVPRDDPLREPLDDRGL